MTDTRATITDNPTPEPAPAVFTREEVTQALNQAADDILDAVDAGDEGLRDGLNLLVNASVAYLAGEADNLQDVVEGNYGDEDYETVLSWIEQAA
jgi:hypothetical protein